VVAITLAASSGNDALRERPAATPVPTPLPDVVSLSTFLPRFSALRDPSTVVAAPRNLERMISGPLEETHLLRTVDGLSLWVGWLGDQVCMYAGYGDVTGGGGCAPRERLADIAAGRNAPSYGTTRSIVNVEYLVPDGTTDASITYQDGTSEPVSIVNNAILVVTHRRPQSLSWTSPDGVVRTFDLGGVPDDMAG
jgi:hypothetical protein